MKVDKFILEYSTAGDKDKFLSERIKNKYIGFIKKIEECNKVLDFSCYMEIDGVKKFRHNSPLQYFLFIITLIKNYTDIELNDDALFEDFDALNERGILKRIIAAIPEDEYVEFNTVLNMCIDDLMENERSVVGFLDNKSEIARVLLSSLDEYVNKMENEDGETLLGTD